MIDADGYDHIMSLHDNDSKCGPMCKKAILKKLGGGKGYDFFEKLLTEIYGDAISLDPFQPQEVHLAITPSPDAMKVMWVTMSKLLKPFAEYKLFTDSDDKDWTVATAIDYTYQVPKKWWATFTGLIYETDMTGLTPGAKYKYRVGGFDIVNNTMRYSKEFTFNAAPVPSANQKTTFAYLADHGTFELLGFATVNKMVATYEELDIDIVHVAGDLSYAGLDTEFSPLNITKDDEFSHIWDLLFIQNEPIAANMPWMINIGNHEEFYNFTAQSARYKMPQNDLGSTGNFWFSYDYGNVHVISLSSQHSLDAGSPQIEFLTKDLDAATANRGSVPWIVVGFHKPLYCSIEGSPHFADQLEAILIQYDVDLTITGHMHGYERIHPLQNSVVTCFPTKNADGVDTYYSTGKGPVHIMQCHAGGMQGEKFIQPQPDWSAFRMADGIVFQNKSTASTKYERISKVKEIKDLLDRDFDYKDTYGFGLATFANSTHMYYKTVPVTDSDYGVDTFVIVKRV